MENTKRIVGGTEVDPVRLRYSGCSVWYNNSGFYHSIVFCKRNQWDFINQKNKYPWMAALVDSTGGQFCGGTLVASKYVISAAHCMFIIDQEGIQERPLSELKVWIFFLILCLSWEL